MLLVLRRPSKKKLIIFMVVGILVVATFLAIAATPIWHIQEFLLDDGSVVFSKANNNPQQNNCTFTNTTDPDQASQTILSLSPLENNPQKNEPPLSNLARGYKEPDVIIFGIGDSGTRGVHDFIAQVGQVHMCGGGSDLTGSSEFEYASTRDCQPTRACHHETTILKALYAPSQTATTTTPSRIDSIQAANQKIYNQVIECEQTQSQILFNATRTKLQLQQADYDQEPKSFFWGYKNPKHAYILPAIQEAFFGRTKFVLVLRHPYDICSGDNQKQYKTFKNWFTSFDRSHSKNCMDFWFVVLQQLVQYALDNSQIMRMIRIESLVMDTTTTAEGTAASSARCLSNLIGYKYNPTVTATALSNMQQHQSSYGGYSRTTKPKKRAKRQIQYTKKLYRNCLEDTTPDITKFALRLGYNLSAYGNWTSPQELLPPSQLSNIIC